MGNKAWEILLHRLFIDSHTGETEEFDYVVLKPTPQTASWRDPVLLGEIKVPSRSGRMEIWFANTGRWGTVSFCREGRGEEREERLTRVFWERAEVRFSVW